LPAGFLHGEFYASNVIVSGSDGDFGICAVDWEMAAVGPTFLDLAALASGWEERDVVALTEAYNSALTDSLPEDEFERAFDCARLHLAVQWLGWAREWTPPDEHAQSWLGEAVRMSSKLGL
jgi:thiamine kinase-like enzyme